MSSETTYYLFKSLDFLLALCTFLVTFPLSLLGLIVWMFCWSVSTCAKLFHSSQTMEFMKSEDAFCGVEYESKGLKSVVKCLIIVDGEMSPDLFIRTWKEKTSLNDKENFRKCYQKLYSKVVKRHDYLFWKRTDDFNMDDHFVLYEDKVPTSTEQLKMIITNLANKPMDIRKPLWDVHFIQFYGQLDPNVQKPPAKKTCLLFRLNHMIADGVAGFRFIMENFTDDPTVMKPRLLRLYETIMRTDLSPLLRGFQKTTTTMMSIIYAPLVSLKRIFCIDNSALHGPKLCGEAILDWSPPYPLPLIKDIKNAFSCSLNDVIMSCMSGALRRYLLSQHHRDSTVPDHMEILIPITIKNPDEPNELENNMTAVIPKMPTGDMDPVTRLKKTQQVLRDLKRSPDAFLSKWFMKLVPNVYPYYILKCILEYCGPTAAISNIPGPGKCIYFLGHRLELISAFVPTLGTTGLTIFVSSYVDEVRLSVTVDKGLISDRKGTELLLQCFEEELSRLNAALCKDCVIAAQ